MKNIIVIGATSGLGLEVARIYLEKGYKVGVAARRTERLDILKRSYPDNCFTKRIDVTSEDAVANLESLMEEMGGMDLFFLSAGTGKQNKILDPDIEMTTVHINVAGFTRMTTTAFDYFKNKKSGHIAVISSIAGTKGIGVAPSYSATKRFQNTYMESLEQLARSQNLNISFTDIRPGFVDTDLLADRNYPMLMDASETAHKIVKAISNKKRVAIIDGRYNLLVIFWRMIPKWLWVRIKL